MLRIFLATILVWISVSASNADTWQMADDALAKQVINCLIDGWLRKTDYRTSTVRYDIVLTIKSIEQFRVPTLKQDRRMRKKSFEPPFCKKGGQRDYHSLLLKGGRLVLTNGRPLANDGEVRGFAYGLMDVYRNGYRLAIYLQSGPYFRKPKKGGGDCEYDATFSGYRLYLGNRSQSIVSIGATDLWIADVGMPNCMLEK